jgi:hypothetical protein
VLASWKKCTSHEEDTHQLHTHLTRIYHSWAFIASFTKQLVDTTYVAGPGTIPANFLQSCLNKEERVS